MPDTPTGPARSVAPSPRAPSPRAPLALAAPAPAVSWRALAGILHRRRLTLLGFALLIPSLAWIALHRVTPLYTATGTLIFEPDHYQPRALRSILRTDRVTAAVMASQAALLGGLRLIEPMAERLHLFRDPAFNPALRPPGLLMRLAALLPGPQSAGPQPAPRAGARSADPSPGPSLGPGNDTAQGTARDTVLLAVQRAVRVRIVPDSHVIAVSFTAADPVLAAAGANLLMDIYIKGQLGAKYAAVHKARRWLEARAETLRRAVRQADDRIAAYRARKGLVRGVHAGLGTEQISQLTQTLAAARAALAAAQGRLDAARGGTVAGGAAAGGGAAAAIAPSVVALRARHDAMAAQLRALLTRLGPRHPEVLALRSQLRAVDGAIGRETARVIAATEATVNAAHQRVAALETDLTAARRQVDRNAQAAIPLHAMERDADVSRTLLIAVLEQLQQIRQQAAVESPDAHEVSLALPPAAPSWPDRGKLLAAAVAFGTLFGLFVVYLLEITDTTLPSGEAVRATLHRPCFALIPEIGRRALGRLRVEDYAALQPRSPLAEQLRGLRAGLWLGEPRPRVIAITAARAGEGKTAVAVALARAAAMGGERVALLDCDPRRDTIARLMGSEGRPGLADHLRGAAPLEAVLRKDPLTDLSYVGAGTPGPDGFGRAAAAALDRTLAALREEYDLVLLDAPPVHAMSETRLIARAAEATLFCLRWRATPREVAASAIALLEEAQARVLGVALTRVDPRAHARSGAADADAYPARRDLDGGF